MRLNRPVGPAVTKIVLVRHAQAVCNVKDTFSGHSGCAGLSDAGWDQCAPAAQRISQLYGLDELAIVSSQMPRAEQTADAIAKRLGFAGGVERRCGLCERHPGSLDGKANSVVADLTDRGELPEDVERPEAFMLRVRRELRRLAKEHTGQTVITVTHTGVVAASFWIFGGVPGRLPFGVRPDNASITEWMLTDGDPAGWTLARYNDSVAVWHA